MCSIINTLNSYYDNFIDLWKNKKLHPKHYHIPKVPRANVLIHLYKNHIVKCVIYIMQLI